MILYSDPRVQDVLSQALGIPPCYACHQARLFTGTTCASLLTLGIIRVGPCSAKFRPKIPEVPMQAELNSKPFTLYISVLDVLGFLAICVSIGPGAAVGHMALFQLH